MTERDSRTPIVTRPELTGRIQRFQQTLGEQEVDAAVLLQRVDLIYYTGSVYQGALVVPAEGEPALLVWRGRGRIGPECPVEPVELRGMGKLPAALTALPGAGGWKRIGFEEDVVPVAWWRLLGPGVWPRAEYVDISGLIRRQRSVKSPSELAQVRLSGKALSAGFEALRDLLRTGVPEYEAQARMDLVKRQAGDQAAGRVRAFNGEAAGVIAWGPSAATDNAFDGPIGQPGRNPLAPMGAGEARIVPGLPIICDHTAGVNGYMTDMTRTFSLGPLEARFEEAHAFCVQVHQEVLRWMVPGAVPAEIYGWALQQAEQAGLADGFMNRGSNQVRFLGHGIGLEMDEWPVLARPFTEPLVEGQVVAVEPKVIFPDGGVGVEDTVIVQPGGAEVVTHMELGLIRLEA